MPVPLPMHVPPRPKGLAIAALIVGISSLVLCWIPFVGMLGGLAAIVLGIIALVKAQSKGMSITGLITGIVGFLAGIVLTLTAFTLFSLIGAQTASTDPSAESAPGPADRQQDKGQTNEPEIADDLAEDTDAILRRICDEYQVCSVAGEPQPSYSPEYCANIRYFFGTDSSEQIKKATALAGYDDAHAKYWQLAADIMSHPSRTEVPDDVGKIISELYFEGYFNCNFED